ncbi:hypothetical protein FPOAC1_011257 [Fusarium poae]|uniref:hypothetical protein n=1 Tax=Fusarium poae TaxID=36050 RepID=UPI001CE7AEF4|nr:hypothetical protein FPOAC1_011257 [Fusarium poae]KAG8666450.1 hypothetical protein FPOAC1_011257 [Fusarium poae]
MPISELRCELLQCQKEGCTEGFPTLAALKKHTETGHSNKFSCPDDGCTKLFKTQAEADQHWDSDHNGQAFDCGICGLVLSTLQARRRHELQHTHPFVCPRPGCFRRFETFGESLQHGLAEEDHDYLLTPLFRCQIPKCRVAMTARPMAKHELNKHWRAHIANGQVEPETDLIPIPAEPWKFRTLPLFEKILEHNASLAAGDVSSVQNMEESEHVGEDGKDGHTDEDPSLQFEDTDADNIIEDRGDLFSERHRGILLEQNEAYWEGRKHLKSRLIMEHWEGRDMDFNFATLRKVFMATAETQWTVGHNYDRIIQRTREIEDHKRQGTSLIVLDTEYSIASRQVMEVAAVERISGNKVLNTLVTHEKGISHISSTGETTGNEILMSRIHAAGVYAPGRIIDRMNVHEFAKSIVESGITPDTIMLVWHLYDRDLKVIRDYLASAKRGYEKYLPPQSNCIPLIQFFRPMLREYPVPPRGKKRFPLKLEILFPLMFPRSGLVGRNHQALVDSQQTRLVMVGFDWLCKSVKQRGTTWRSENFDMPSHRSIEEFFVPDAQIQGTAESTGKPQIRESSKDSRSSPKADLSPTPPAGNGNGKRKPSMNASLEDYFSRRPKQIKPSNEQ